MARYPEQFGIVLKSARKERKLTQEELAEKLDISVPYLKDLEGFRNLPSYTIFERVIHYFNLPADMVLYPDRDSADDSTYQKIHRLLTHCDEEQLQVVLATTEALLSAKRKLPKAE